MTESKEEEVVMYNILLVGKTGKGKSATGNTILGRTLFTSKADTSSCTKSCSLECAQFRRNNKTVLIRVVDSPGLKDTVESQVDTLSKICEAMSLCPEGFNALILVLKFNERCTAEELEVFRILKRALGPEFMQYCIIIITHGINFNTEYEDAIEQFTFMDWCKQQTGPAELLELFQECDYRIILFYNKGKRFEEERKQSVGKLFELLEKKTTRYTHFYFAKCAQEREKLALELKLPELKPKIQEKISLLKGELQVAMSSNDIDFVIPIKERAKQLIEELKHENKGNILDDFIDTVESIVLQIDDIKNVDVDDRKRYFQLVDEYLKKKSYLEGFKFPTGFWGKVVEFCHVLNNAAHYIDFNFFHGALKSHVEAIEKQLLIIRDKFKKPLLDRKREHKDLTGVCLQIEEKAKVE